MASKKKDDVLDVVGKDGETKLKESVQNLTDEHKKALAWLINENKALADKKKQYSEDVKGLADKLGTKAGKVSKVISMIIQEEEKGGVVKEQNSAIEWVDQYLDRKED